MTKVVNFVTRLPALPRFKLGDRVTAFDTYSCRVIGRNFAEVTVYDLVSDCGRRLNGIPAVNGGVELIKPLEEQKPATA